MSTVSEKNPSSRDFDYWEFVHCAICFLSFIADPVNAPTAPPSVPFWLTECGHTLCNNHLHADQSCAACGATAIQLVPLQRDMMPPMCDWFRSVPHGLDAIASAAKSQQETMASLVRFYKRKCNQQRTSMNKTKNVAAENKDLRSQIEQLQQEVAQLRESAGVSLNQHFDQTIPYGPNRHNAVKEALSYQPSEALNVNGKRPLAGSHPNRTSSPRSIITPIAPSRITLPPDHQQPVFPSGVISGSQNEEIRDPPGSSRFEQYAYQPPVATFRAPPLRHQQQPQGHGQMQQEQEHRQQQQQMPATGNRQHNYQQQQQRIMLPPPTPSRAQGGTNGRTPFRPAGQILPSMRRTQVQVQTQPPAPAPSATPLRQSRPQHVHQPRPFPMSVQTPQSSRLVQHGPSGVRGHTSAVPAQRRFTVPSTPSNRFFPPRSMEGVVIGMPGAGYMSSNNGGGSTRAPFVPGSG